jgi:hypothetical protein
MRRLLRGFSVLALLLLTAAALASPDVKAAEEGFNVLTSPLPVKLVTQPGKTVTTDLRIKNLANKPQPIKVGLMKFGASGDTGQPNLFELTPKDTYASWVHFSPKEFVAQPNVWNTVTMTINVPPDAALGYYLAVTFSPSSVVGNKDATTFKGSTATLVLLDVSSGNEKRDLNLLDFSTDHKLYEYLPVNFNVKLRNTGNIYLPPSGNIFIMRGDTTIETLEFNAAGGSVLPQSNRIFKEPWKKGFPVFRDRLVDGKPVTDSNGGLKQDLKWDFTKANKFRFGKYTAKLLVVYDDGQKDVPLESVLTFWVIPWKLLVVFLLVLGLIGFGVFTLLRSSFRRAKQGTGKLRRARRK